jgi:RHS repeat-associated protein|nr:RHS repeat-associated core domain-containing protein [Kofleriaceae bacterium]
MTTFTYNDLGERTSDEGAAFGGSDERTYEYDARHNLTQVRGQYKVSTAWHFYDVNSTFDERNRRVSKSFYDETTAKTSTWFFYYDIQSRLTQVRYTPDVSAPATYSLINLMWLGQRLVMYLESDWPAGTGSKRYVGTDETGRPIDMWSWPASGNAARVWATNPSAWGMDKVVTGGGVFQPVLFAGQYQDVETTAFETDGATIHRPGLALNGFRTYDPFIGGYLQTDPMVAQTWSSYVYVDSDPVGARDELGLDCGNECPPGGGGDGPEGPGGGKSCDYVCAAACSDGWTEWAAEAFCDCDYCNSLHEEGTPSSDVCGPGKMDNPDFNPELCDGVILECKKKFHISGCQDTPWCEIVRNQQIKSFCGCFFKINGADKCQVCLPITGRECPWEAAVDTADGPPPPDPQNGGGTGQGGPEGGGANEHHPQ